ncbi:hypothetical protein BSKO_11721 [Bryopsis sp. KO-2023]|nr:hypothetical protein BSKO_11721 [Bryopsis sp. KO-2023]
MRGGLKGKDRREMKSTAMVFSIAVVATSGAVAAVSEGAYIGRGLLAHTSSKSHKAHIFWAMLAILGLGVLMGSIIFCFWCFSLSEDEMEERDQSVYKRAYKRLKSQQAFFNLPSIKTGRYCAEYAEYGCKKEASYFLEFDDDGKVEGSVIRDKDYKSGLLEVRGRFNADKRTYEWAETKPGATYRDISDPEACKSALKSGKPFHIEVVVKVVCETASILEGRYYSSFGTRGKFAAE